jgi:hypothetical protein
VHSTTIADNDNDDKNEKFFAFLSFDKKIN